VKRTGPRIIAHRGASAEAPENTLEAFALACALGADGVELDIHETRDGGFVVHHDPDLPQGRIRELDLSAIRGRPAKVGGEVPALTDALALLAERGPGTHVFVEIKSMRAEARSADTLRRTIAPWRQALRLELQSFSSQLLQLVVAGADGYATGLIARAPGRAPVSTLESIGAAALSLHHGAVTADLVARLHDSGKLLYAWTVNDSERASALAANGVDAVITDTPRTIISG